MEINSDKAARLVEAGDGCPALDGYLIGSTATKSEWSKLLQDVVDANAKHRAKDSNVPELMVVETPDEGLGASIGLTRKDLEEAGALGRLVDRNFGLAGNPESSRFYDCNDLPEKYRHGNLPKRK